MEYTDRILKAIEYTELNLEQPLDSAMIAGEAAMSLRNFHRIFQQITGDTIKEYIRGRRLTLASQELANTPERILDIAVKYQFNSQEVFSRAFQRQFWSTPGAFRKTGSDVAPQQKLAITGHNIAHLLEGLGRHPEMITLPARKIVGIQQSQHAYGLDLPEQERRTGEMLEEYYFKRCRIQNVCRHSDDWLSPDLHLRFRLATHSGERDQHTYMVGTVVDDISNVPDGLSSISIPECTYAVFSHRGDLSLFPYSMGFIYNCWLKHSGLFFGNAPNIFQPFTTDYGEAGGLYFMPVSASLVLTDWWC